MGKRGLNTFSRFYLKSGLYSFLFYLSKVFDLFLPKILKTFLFTNYRASREEMAQRANVQQQQPSNGNNKPIPSNIKSNLVQNAQPMAVSGAPGFDSNV